MHHAHLAAPAALQHQVAQRGLAEVAQRMVPGQSRARVSNSPKSRAEARGVASSSTGETITLATGVKSRSAS